MISKLAVAALLASLVNIASANTWAPEDVAAYNKTCMASAASPVTGLYCSCILSQTSLRYSSLSEFNGADVSSQIKIHELCAANGPWSENLQMEFASHCVGVLMTRSGLTATESNKGCLCLEEKLRTQYPNADAVANQVGAELKDIIGQCTNLGKTAASWPGQEAVVLEKSCRSSLSLQNNGNNDDARVNKFCSCFTTQAQALYPNYTDVYDKTTTPSPVVVSSICAANDGWMSENVELYKSACRFARSVNANETAEESAGVCSCVVDSYMSTKTPMQDILNSDSTTQTLATCANAPAVSLATSDSSSLSGLQVFVIVISALALVGGAGAVYFFYFKRKATTSHFYPEKVITPSGLQSSPFASTTHYMAELDSPSAANSATAVEAKV